jgi:hypothetical protein
MVNFWDAPVRLKQLGSSTGASQKLTETQYQLHANGRFIARFDLAYPEYRLGIEYDGGHHHRDPVPWKSAGRSKVGLAFGAASPTWPPTVTRTATT